MRTFISNVSAQILATLVLAALGGVAVWLASLNPVLEKFAPFSYLVAFLLVLAIGALVAFLVGKARHIWWPTNVDTASASEPQPGSSSASVTYDDAEIRSANAQISSRVDDLAGKIEGLERAVRWQQAWSPAARIAISRERKDAIERIIEMADDAIGSEYPGQGVDQPGVTILQNYNLDRTRKIGDIEALIRAYELLPPEQLEKNRQNIAFHYTNGTGVVTWDKEDAAFPDLETKRGWVIEEETIKYLKNVLADRAQEIDAEIRENSRVLIELDKQLAKERRIAEEGHG